jgi:hypothetical protein
MDMIVSLIDELIKERITSYNNASTFGVSSAKANTLKEKLRIVLIENMATR